jgi:hypothetical protein
MESEIEVNFSIGTRDGKATEQTFGIVGRWPADWWDTVKHPELWDVYVIPAIQQLRQQAAYRAHGDGCVCHICDGRIDMPHLVSK